MNDVDGATMLENMLDNPTKRLLRASGNRSLRVLFLHELNTQGLRMHRIANSEASHNFIGSLVMNKVPCAAVVLILH